MSIALLIARLALAAIFAVAGLSKLADREGSTRTMTDFGVPAVLSRPLGILLPLAELVVAVALLFASSAWWGALGALGLLGFFVLGISWNLARGREPECHCFGQLHSAPAGPGTLVRNGLLALVAAFVIWQGYDDVGPGILGWISSLSAAGLVWGAVGVLVLALLVGQWWFLLHLLGQNGRLLVRVEALEEGLVASGGAPSPNGNGARPEEGLPEGSEAPPFSLEGLHGETISLEELRSAGKPVVLLFGDPGCSPCAAMLPEIGRWQEEHSEKLTVSLVSRGDVEVNRAKASEHNLTNVLLQEDWEISEAYHVRGTPSAVLVGTEGRVASPLMGGEKAIRALVAHVATHGAPTTRGIGDPAPEVRLPDLRGETVDLQDFGGEETLVLFWNPGCGFCRGMLPDLKEWEENRPEEAPRLLVVSTGTVEANTEMALDSTVVLDQQFAVGRSFGANGTPSAVLVDGKGQVASEVVVGAEAVLQLAGASRAER